MAPDCVGFDGRGEAAPCVMRWCGSAPPGASGARCATLSRAGCRCWIRWCGGWGRLRPPGLDVVCDGALWTQFSPGPGDDPVGPVRRLAVPASGGGGGALRPGAGDPGGAAGGGGLFSALPPQGAGCPLSRRELEEKLEQLHPSVFFSHELCARYFTYMSRESGGPLRPL